MSSIELATATVGLLASAVGLLQEVSSWRGGGRSDREPPAGGGRGEGRPPRPAVARRAELAFLAGLGACVTAAALILMAANSTTGLSRVAATGGVAITGTLAAVAAAAGVPYLWRTRPLPPRILASDAVLGLLAATAALTAALLVAS